MWDLLSHSTTLTSSGWKAGVALELIYSECPSQLSQGTPRPIPFPIPLQGWIPTMGIFARQPQRERSGWTLLPTSGAAGKGAMLAPGFGTSEAALHRKALQHPIKGIRTSKRGGSARSFRREHNKGSGPGPPCAAMSFPSQA